jgi:hypothetical protein
MIVPPEAITAAAVALHDEQCDDGGTQACGRWKCGSDPANRFYLSHHPHVLFYENLARLALTAAAPLIAAAAIKAPIEQSSITGGEWG